MTIELERALDPRTLIISPRPVWKCRGCPEYGLRPSCPPAAPDWREAREWLQYYSRALLITFRVEVGDRARFEIDKRAVLNYLLERERALFPAHPFALALFPGNCNLCEECACIAGGPGRCTDPTRVRPSVDAIGIELATAITLQFDAPHLHGMLLIE